MDHDEEEIYAMPSVHHCRIRPESDSDSRWERRREGQWQRRRRETGHGAGGDGGGKRKTVNRRRLRHAPGGDQESFTLGRALQNAQANTSCPPLEYMS
jgi:hypothetical protein